MSASALASSQQQPTTTAFSIILSQHKSLQKQIEEASTAAITDSSTISELPKIVIQSRTYVLESHLDKKRTKGRSSFIRNFGNWLVELDSNNKPTQGFWSCRFCSRTSRPRLYNADSTSSAIAHLRKAHSIVEISSADQETPTVLELQGSAAAKRPALDIYPKPKVKRIRDLAVGYVLNTDSPFTSFDDPFLKALLAEFDPDLAKNAALGRTALAGELDRLFESSRALIKHDIHDAVTSMHISFDLWTSPNHLTMIAIFGHFLDRGLQYRARLLALRQHEGTHSSENISNSVEQVVKDWEIGQRVGAAVTDNASNNDICLETLYPRLNPEFNKTDVKHRRLRCFGHTLNFVAKAFLYGDDADVFEDGADALEQQQQDEQSLDHWRRKGPVGKLHNVVKFIRASPQRMEAFRKIAREDDAVGNPDGFSISEISKAELELKQNNATRWNSTYLMIKRAWEKQSF